MIGKISIFELITAIEMSFYFEGIVFFAVAILHFLNIKLFIKQLLF